MWIERIEIDAFGKLHDYQLELGQGAQVLYGKNEEGKTTLMAFLKLMFYGKTPRLQGLEHPRKRYMPWDGRRMGGAIEFVSDGMRYRLQKEFGDTAGRDKVRLLRGGEVVPLGKDEEAGQRFFGLDLAGFERSSFIGRVGRIDAGKSDAVAERLLANLVQSGDETIPAQEVLDRLFAAKWDLVSKSGGKGQLAEARQRMQMLRDELAATEAQIREQQGVSEQCRKLEDNVRRNQALEAKGQAASAWQRAQRLDALLEKAEQLAGQIAEIERQGISWPDAEKFLNQTEPMVEEYRLAVRSLDDFRASGAVQESGGIEEEAYLRIQEKAETLDVLEQLLARLEQDLLPAAADLCMKRQAATQAERDLQHTQTALAEQEPKRMRLAEQRGQEALLAEQLDTLRGERETQRTVWAQEQTEAKEQQAEAERALALQVQMRQLHRRPPYLAIGLALLSVLAAVLLEQPFLLLGLVLAAVLFWHNRRKTAVSEQELAAQQASTQAAEQLAAIQRRVQEQDAALSAEIDRIRIQLENVEQALAQQAEDEAVWTALDRQLQQNQRAAEQQTALKQAAEQVYQRTLAAVRPLAEKAGLAVENVQEDAVRQTIQAFAAIREQETKALADQLSRYGCETVAELRERLLEQRANARSRAAMQEREKAVKQHGQVLMAQIEPYRAVSSPEQAAAFADELRRTLDATARLEAEVRGAAAGLGMEDIRPERLRAKRQALTLAMQAYVPGHDPAPEVLREQVELARQSDAAQQLLTLQKRLRAPERTPAEIALDIDALAEEIAEMERYAAAVDLALEIMQEAAEEMRSSFGPALNQATGEILSALTGGAYDQVLVSKDYGVSVKSGVHYREHHYFSSGTIDQVYFALRLAMSRLISKGQEPLPLFLDDILMQYDAGRAAQCLDYLAQCGRQGTQILLFTCHPHIVECAQAAHIPNLPLHRA